MHPISPAPSWVPLFCCWWCASAPDVDLVTYVAIYMHVWLLSVDYYMACPLLLVHACLTLNGFVGSVGSSNIYTYIHMPKYTTDEETHVPTKGHTQPVATNEVNISSEVAGLRNVPPHSEIVTHISHYRCFWLHIHQSNPQLWHQNNFYRKG